MRNFYLIILCASLSATTMYSMNKATQLTNLLYRESTITWATYDEKNWDREIIHSGYGTKPRQVELRRPGWLYDEVVTLRKRSKTSQSIDTWQTKELTGLSKTVVGGTLIIGAVYYYLQDNDEL